FTPSMGVIVVVLVAAILLMGFFSVYVRRCSDGSVSVGSIRRGLSMRARRHASAAARGLDAETVEAFPTFSYSEVKDHKIGKGALECAVCLNEFEEDDALRLLPKCDHVFHRECIGAWLEHHVTCPVCRANLQQPPRTPPPVPNAGGESDGPDDRSSVSRGAAEIAITVDELPPPVPEIPPSEAPPPPPQPRTRSVRRQQKTIVGFAKFKSHSTGHSLVLPGENLERFTLRLPEGVRKDVIDRATLNRTTSSYAGVGPSRGGGEGSSRGGSRHREAKSDRWAIFGRALS
ncbi:hypothetical protein M569_08227, partial [Genlisea aurea]